MLGEPPVICNECHTQKGAANKWLTGVANEAETYLQIRAFDAAQAELSARSSVSCGAEGTLVRCDWCSERCLHVQLSRTIAKIRALVAECEQKQPHAASEGGVSTDSP